MHSELTERISEEAIAYVHARKARREARAERNRQARIFIEENGENARYEPIEGEQEQDILVLSSEYKAATLQAQTAYWAAIKAEKSKRQRLYALVAMRDKAHAIAAARSAM